MELLASESNYYCPEADYEICIINRHVYIETYIGIWNRDRPAEASRPHLRYASDTGADPRKLLELAKTTIQLNRTPDES